VNKTGILLINLGTPDSAKPRDVYRYLTEFLNDPRVIDVPALVRWILRNLVIVPFRHRKSAEAYQKVWTDEGSPLLVHSRKLQTALAVELGNDYHVELAMRYGNPTVNQALDTLKDCKKLTIIPLFPQYSSAASGSAMEKILQAISKQWNVPQLTLLRDFYDHPGFIEAYADIIRENIQHKQIDQLIFSYHGLPERHIDKSECQAKCNRLDACPTVDKTNHYCYRAQCYETSRLLAGALKLEPHQYTVAFQSRLGRTPWIKPYTDLLLPELIAQGKKNIAVVCPSFVADCLETLEEINMQAREQWAELGGNEFIFIPCINDHPLWVKALAGVVSQ
jgi:protoporphyrin/coproporphyrin ferrochelatase